MPTCVEIIPERGRVKDKSGLMARGLLARVNDVEIGSVYRVPSPSTKPKPSPQRTQFSKNVARLRSKAKLTQEQLAEKTDLTVRYIQQIEAGDNWPSLPKLAALREALGSTWDVLMDGITSQQD